MRPPKIAAANPLTAIPMSASKVTGWSGARSTPATPPRAPPSANATYPIRVGSMPTSRAAPGLLAQAVRPLPR